MSAASDASERRRQLEQILQQALAQSSAALVAACDADADAVSRHLESVPLDRLRAAADLLRASTTRQDDLDAIAVRLLLSDYKSAVAHLRAVARAADARVTAAASPIKETRRFLWKHRTRDETPPTGAPPA